MTLQLRALGAPSPQLRLESFKVFSRLERIIEFKRWLDYTRIYCHQKEEPTHKILFDCFALGAPLGILLDLLGSPSSSYTNAYVETFDFVGVKQAERESFFASFLQRIHLLEVQGRLPFGEVLHLEDLFEGSASGFMKVLKTVQRVLDNLHATYPGLFLIPEGSEKIRQDIVQELIETERAHVSFLRMVVDSGAALSASGRVAERALEGLMLNNTRLREYHDRLSRALESLPLTPCEEQRWEYIFGFHDPTTRTNVATSYRSTCVNYLSLHDFLQDMMKTNEPALAAHTQILLDVLCHIPTRIIDYHSKLKKILQLTLPTLSSPQSTFDSLCNTIFHLSDIAIATDEISRQLRTYHSTHIIRSRAFYWPNNIDPDDLGTLLLDDVLVMGDTGMAYESLLFEEMLLCCLGGSRDDEDEMPVYPIRAWVLGPVLKKSTPLNLVYAIPTRSMRVLRVLGSFSFEIEWTDDAGVSYRLEFSSSCEAQNEQWCSLLRLFALSVYEAESDSEGDDLDVLEPEEVIFSEDECPDGRRRTHPRPWSLIARKEPRSESSSLLRQEIYETENLLSPTLLPTLFSGLAMERSKSPVSIGFQDVEPLPMRLTDEKTPFTPSPEVSFLGQDATPLLDLTGLITKDGRFPEAHGGFADVWKATWRDGDRLVPVAVKVLRSYAGSLEMGEKMRKKLSRELEVWRKLDHPNILTLYGTVSDFGPYESMVCPWHENGSVTRYLERCGDILSMTDRLQLLCEVAEGLSYLHSFDIVHGDLTGSNVLINCHGKACLCDFGLSSIIAECGDSSRFTSSISGAIRWADASLYKLQVKEDSPPVLTTRSDIYSLGSVMLEILSGRIPYHYVRNDAQVVIELHRGNKPRRPAPLFVTDQQWALIMRCWEDDLEKRPDVNQVLGELQVLHRASLEFRRHSA
ncbi:hypothetical protein WG66_003719 [Moniliophthora roreri]|uniref:Putative TKL/TKL-ccin protein kinase n=1 Tax=Moniliophthora roreri TaxID=221103 RepID=A0A0W0GBJ3_MONRR|nr:hypothetical protein WG66_003719 [Moniliophthora roreri]